MVRVAYGRCKCKADEGKAAGVGVRYIGRATVEGGARIITM